jgi:perosamine synthetase
MINIPIYSPDLSGNEQRYVNECIQTSWISSRGRFISEFEREFSKRTNNAHATGVSNGTVALHLAVVALGIGPDDEVIVPTLTYIASVNAIVYAGATPVFCDSIESSWQLDPEDVERRITPKTRAILAVHLYGQSCDMDTLISIAKKHNLFIVEDCAEAFGTMYKGKHVGTFGDISTFSFYGNKTITTGEGGMVTSNSKTLIEKVRHLKGQGLAPNREYWHNVLGYNYRMTNIQAAIGLAQLERCSMFIFKKRAIAANYRKQLDGLPLTPHSEQVNTLHSYWMVSFLVDRAELRDPLREYLKSNGVETRPLFYPAHTMPMYSKNHQEFPVAENLARRGMNLPSWPGLTDDDITIVCGLIKDFYEKEAFRHTN